MSEVNSQPKQGEIGNGQNADTVKQKQAASKTKKKQPSQEEIEQIRKQRAEKKEREAKEKQERINNGDVQKGKDGKQLFAPRQWVGVRDVQHGQHSTAGRQMIRLLTWNMLAQGLVRRKVYPGSDCLKWKDRKDCLAAELVSHDWDVAAFQEVDRMDEHGPNLERSGRKYIYAKGYSDKQHGLLISWRTKRPNSTTSENTFNRCTFQEQPAASKVFFFDREHIDDTTGKKGSRTALSRVTRNIALLVALKSSNDEKDGVIVATTHLFWHPMHAYERARQTGILKRRLVQWRQEHAEYAHWPLILAGDFNDQPHSATYKLVTGQTLTSHCINEVRQSTVVHQSVDELRKKVAEDSTCATIEEAIVENGHAAQADGLGQGSTDAKLDEECEDFEDDDGNDDEEEDEDEEGGDDRMLKNCRQATKQDGLMSFEEMVQLHDLSQPPPGADPMESDDNDGKKWLTHTCNAGLTSVYGQYFNKLEVDQEGNYFGSDKRWRERHDDHEWTPEDPNPHLDSSFE